jgi:hypothetical protein
MGDRRPQWLTQVNALSRTRGFAAPVGTIFAGILLVSPGAPVQQGFSEHAHQGSASHDSDGRHRGWGACSRLGRLGEAQGNVIANDLRVTREVTPAAGKIGSGRPFYVVRVGRSPD